MPKLPVPVTFRVAIELGNAPVGPTTDGPTPPVGPVCDIPATPVGPVKLRPLGPVEPDGPVDPVEPTLPDTPVGPVKPRPVGPVEPEGPEEPVEPTPPVGPVRPTAPVVPIKLGQIRVPCTVTSDSKVAGPTHVTLGVMKSPCKSVRLPSSEVPTGPNPTTIDQSEM